MDPLRVVRRQHVRLDPERGQVLRELERSLDAAAARGRPVERDEQQFHAPDATRAVDSRRGHPGHRRGRHLHRRRPARGRRAAHGEGADGTQPGGVGARRGGGGRRRRARALHARDDDRDERAAGAARRADGARRDRGLRARAPPAPPGSRAPLPALRPASRSRSCRSSARSAFAAGSARTASSRRSSSTRCPTWAMPRRSPSACSSPSATPRTSRPSSRSCGGGTRTRTSSPRTSRRPSSASTSARRRRPRTPTSALSSAATCARSRARCEEAGLPVPLIMRSSGGVAPLEEAAAHAARALLSGPAAGVVGASRVARLAGIENALAFDMGGTSTDVCAIVGGEATRSSERLVGGLPIRLPTLDVHTVGAGGGSIVWRDAGGALRVGPAERGRRARARLLRPRRRAADGHRREPAARPAAGPPRRRASSSTATPPSGRWRRSARRRRT